MTDQQYADWLELPSANRVVLLEIAVNSGGSETTRYVASKAYISAAADTPASTFYDNCVIGPIQMQEQLGMGNEAATFSIADIELRNDDGALDSWLNDVFTNRTITIYFGDVSWPKSDFRVVYVGLMEILNADDPSKLKLSMSDKMQQLENSVTEALLGGTTPNAGALIPLCFGECHNVTPLLTDPLTLEYAVHNGPIEAIIEVRDNGVPVNYTPNLPNGRFTLTASPVGTITVSVQGDKPSSYFNDVGNLVQRLATGYGKAGFRFTTADFDMTALTAFISANPQPVGIYITNTMSVRDACAQLASSVGAKLTMSRTGLLRLVKIALPSTPTKTVNIDNEAMNGMVRLSSRTKVVAACKLAFCKNWTVQESMQSGVVAQHKEMYAQEWLTTTATHTTTATLYKISNDAEQETSLLLRKTDADPEAVRRRDLRRVQRGVYEYQAFANHLQCELGQGIALSASRYGLSALAGQVVSLSMDWISETVAIGVLG